MTCSVDKDLLWIKVEQKDFGYDPFRAFYNTVIFYSGCLLQSPGKLSKHCLMGNFPKDRNLISIMIFKRSQGAYHVQSRLRILAIVSVQARVLSRVKDCMHILRFNRIIVSSRYALSRKEYIVMLLFFIVIFICDEHVSNIFY